MRGVLTVSDKVTKIIAKSLKYTKNSLLARLWPTTCNFTKKFPRQIFSRTLLKLSKLLFWRVSLWWVLLLLDKNSRYYEPCIKQPPLRQFSILINDSDLRKIDLHETSACSLWDSLFHLFSEVIFNKFSELTFFIILAS